MRLLHMGDTHIGYRATQKKVGWKNLREDDVDQVWESLVDRAVSLCEAGEIDMLIHAGDVFHNHMVTMDSISRFIRGIRRLQEYSLPIVIIAGNHDIGRVRQAGNVFDVMRAALSDDNTYVVDGYEPTYLEFDGVDVTCIPWFAWEGLNLNQPRLTQTDRLQLLVAHGNAEGCADVIETFDELHLFKQDMDRYDYVALGHLHAENVIQDNAAYSSSMDRFGWTDKYAIPGFNIVDVERGRCEIAHEELTTRPFCDLGNVACVNRPTEEVITEAKERLELFFDTDAFVRLRFVTSDAISRRTIQRELKAWFDDPWRLTIVFDDRVLRGFETEGEAEHKPIPTIMQLYDMFLEDRKERGYQTDSAQPPSGY